MCTVRWPFPRLLQEHIEKFTGCHTSFPTLARLPRRPTVRPCLKVTPFISLRVQIEGLRKVYPVSKGAKVAVKNTSLGIPRGECFGLLGINGAGKSSTLAILSG